MATLGTNFMMEHYYKTWDWEGMRDLDAALMKHHQLLHFIDIFTYCDCFNTGAHTPYAIKCGYRNR